MDPRHHERAGNRAGWNADHEVPRLVVDHRSCGVERIPIQKRRPARTTTFRTCASAGHALADHHEIRRAERDTDGGVCEGPRPTRSIRTRPQDGHRSDSHGMTEWQKGQGRYPVCPLYTYDTADE